MSAVAVCVVVGMHHTLTTVPARNFTLEAGYIKAYLDSV